MVSSAPLKDWGSAMASEKTFTPPKGGLVRRKPVVKPAVNAPVVGSGLLDSLKALKEQGKLPDDPAKLDLQVKAPPESVWEASKKKHGL